MSYCNCGCGGSCGCGRKTVLHTFSSKGSCGCKQSIGHNFCKDPIVYLKTSFEIPEANVPAEAYVTDSSKLYLGQGVALGAYSFQIYSISDANTIELIHNGTATPGVTLVAVHPIKGCYQYPFYYVGAVDQLITFTSGQIKGLDAAFAEVANSILDSTAQMTFGYLGPKKIQLQFELTCEIDNTPEYVEVPLPVSVAVSAPEAVFSCNLNDGSGLEPGIAYRRSNTIIIGLGGGNALSDGIDRQFIVTGQYDLL